MRELNDRAALELLSSSVPLTCSQVSEATGLSKVTTTKLLSRLESRGLVIKVGTRAGGPGRNAALFGLNPSSGYVIGLEVDMKTTSAALADITGQVLAQTTATTDNDAQGPVEAVRALTEHLTRAAGIDTTQVGACVIGIPAVIDPDTYDVGFCYDMPAWRPGILGVLRHRLKLPVLIDNDVNLAALAERAYGSAADARSFVLFWIGRDPGSAVMVGDQLLRGSSGVAGEIGWMPVPGVPVAGGILDRGRGGIGAAFQTLAGRQAVLDLANDHNSFSVPSKKP